MSRYANGSQPTGEYQSRAEYDAGYRDGYRAAEERAKERLAYLEASVAKMMEEFANLERVKPLVISAEDVKQFIGR